MRSSFTCRKVGTWDRLFKFPSEGRHAEDFYTQKNPTASAGFEAVGFLTSREKCCYMWQVSYWSISSYAFFNSNFCRLRLFLSVSLFIYSWLTPKFIYRHSGIKIPENYSTIYYKCISQIFKFLLTSGATVSPKNLVSHIFSRHLLTYASWRHFPFEAKDLFYQHTFSGPFATLQKATISLVLSVRPHETTQLPLDEFSWYFIFGSYSKISREDSSLNRIWRK
jgi:hypothetical protein